MIENIKFKILKVVTALLLWAAFWYTTQGLFIYGADFLDLDINLTFLIYTFWVLALAAVAIFLWRWRFNDFSFLKIKQKWVLWLYLIPAVLAAYILINGDQFGVNRFSYVFAMASTTFLAQDMLTFGFLQTYLEKLMRPAYAWLLTSAAFFVGHGIFELSLTALLYAVGFLLLSFLRYQTKNIYLTNIIHTSFLLLPF